MVTVSENEKIEMMDQVNCGLYILDITAQLVEVQVNDIGESTFIMEDGAQFTFTKMLFELNPMNVAHIIARSGRYY